MKRISTHGIEYKLKTYDSIDDAFGFFVTWKGHEWYVLTFPSEDLTVIYDTATGEWHERVTYFEGTPAGDGYTSLHIEWASIFSGFSYWVKYIEPQNGAPPYALAGSSSHGETAGIIISNNGKTWRSSPSTNMDDGWWYGGGYSPKQDMVIVGSIAGDNLSARTLDGGITFTFDTGISAENGVRWVEWVEEWGLWLASSSGTTDYIYRSATGDSGSWTGTDVTSISTVAGHDFAYSPSLNIGVFVGVSDNFGWSTDGITWNDSVSSPGLSGTWKNVIWVEDLTLFVAVGGLTGGNNTEICTSPDGKNWTARSTPTNWLGNGIAYSPDLSLLVATGQSTAVANDTNDDTCIITSTDAITWTQVTTSGLNVNYLNDCEWASAWGLFIAGGKDVNRDGVMIYSEDGTTWTRATDAAPQ